MLKRPYHGLRMGHFNGLILEQINFAIVQSQNFKDARSDI